MSKLQKTYDSIHRCIWVLLRYLHVMNSCDTKITYLYIKRIVRKLCAFVILKFKKGEKRETMTKHKIILGNSANMSSIENESINLIVTSPPYPMIEMWDGDFGYQDEFIAKALYKGEGYTAFKKMHLLLNKTWKECDRVLKQGGIICINIADATRTMGGRFQLYSNHTQIINYFTGLGYSLLPDVLWHKQVNSPNKYMGSGMYPPKAYVTYEHEYILIFRKGESRTFTDDELKTRRKSAYFWEERNIWFSDLWNIKGVAQNMETEKRQRARNAAYPLEIPYRLVNMFSVEGDIVLDPFVGIRTTTLACMVANRNSIGIEIGDVIYEYAVKRVKEDSQKLNEIIDKRLLNHVNFIDGLMKV